MIYTHLRVLFLAISYSSIMKSLINLLNAKVKFDCSNADIELLWVDDLAIAAESWHSDYESIITCPSLGNYRDDWLVDVVGGVYPDLSVDVEELLINVLLIFEDELVNYWNTDLSRRDSKLASRIESMIRKVAKKDLEKIRNHTQTVLQEG